MLYIYLLFRFFQANVKFTTVRTLLLIAVLVTRMINHTRVILYVNFVKRDTWIKMNCTNILGKTITSVTSVKVWVLRNFTSKCLSMFVKVELYQGMIFWLPFLTFFGIFCLMTSSLKKIQIMKSVFYVITGVICKFIWNDILN